MYHSIHSEFIETPLIEILEEGILACRPLGVGMHTAPMKEYFLASLFLRMTGAQEQKLKCICWELATHDYEFRYKFVRGEKDFSFGEMSTKEDKQKLYKHLIKVVKPKKCYSDRKIVESTAKNIKEILLSSPTLAAWLQCDIAICDIDYLFPNSQANNSQGNNYNDPSVLMGGRIGIDYLSVVYEHRNRCAHNLGSFLSYPPQRLDVLKNGDYPRQNYFYRFIILVLIDEIFVELYKDYKNSIDKHLVL